MTRLHVLSTWALAALLPFSPGCGPGHDEHDGHDHGDHDHGDHDHSHEGHVHVAPHGGELVAIAEEFFNAELLLNSETGELRVYLLDSHAENPVRVTQEAIDLTVQLDSVTHELSLPAVADALTEETVGDSSQFAIQSSALVGVSTFQGSFGRIEGRGEVFESTAFAFPAAAHDHDHGDHDHGDHDHADHDHADHEHAEGGHDHAHSHDGEEHSHEHSHEGDGHDHDHGDHDHSDHDHGA